MQIRSVRHKGLRRLLEEDDHRGVRADFINRIRAILTALAVADSMEELQGPPGWRIHQLVGQRAGVWSFSVSGNWRMTFTIDDNALCDLDLEDYH